MEVRRAFANSSKEAFAFSFRPIYSPVTMTWMSSPWLLLPLATSVLYVNWPSNHYMVNVQRKFSPANYFKYPKMGDFHVVNGQKKQYIHFLN
jgi:hypothetical protein